MKKTLLAASILCATLVPGLSFAVDNAAKPINAPGFARPLQPIPLRMADTQNGVELQFVFVENGYGKTTRYVTNKALTVDGQPVIISAYSEIPYVKSNSKTNGTPVTETSTVNDGFSIKATALQVEKNYIAVDLDFSLSVLESIDQVKVGDQSIDVPKTYSFHTHQKLVLKDGETLSIPVASDEKKGHLEVVAKALKLDR